MKNFKITIKDRKFIVSAEDNVSAVKKLADSLEKETEVGATITDSVDPSHIANYGWQLANYNIIHSIYWEAMDEVAGKYEDKNQFLKALATVIDKKFKELVVKTKAEFEKLVNAGMKNVEDTKKKILSGDVGVKFSKVLKGYKGTDSGEEVDEVKAQDANADLISRLKQGKQHVLQNITNTYSIIESALNKNDISQLEFVSGNGKSIGEAIDGTINYCHKELTARRKTDSDEERIADSGWFGNEYVKINSVNDVTLQNIVKVVKKVAGQVKKVMNGKANDTTLRLQVYCRDRMTDRFNWMELPITFDFNYDVTSKAREDNPNFGSKKLYSELRQKLKSYEGKVIYEDKALVADSDEDVNVEDANKKDIEYVMNHELPMWMKLVGGSGNTYKVSFNGKIAVIKFDTNWDEWVYTINGKGPFSHSSYEYIGRDIERVLNN